MDIKPENILVGYHGNGLQLKICDFGLSSIMPANNSILTEFCGSPGFFAPEVYMQKRFCGFKADIFSLGCIALEMMVPQLFFKEVQQVHIRYYIVHIRYDSMMVPQLFLCCIITYECMSIPHCMSVYHSV